MCLLLEYPHPYLLHSRVPGAHCVVSGLRMSLNAPQSAIGGLGVRIRGARRGELGGLPVEDDDGVQALHRDVVVADLAA
jgi:hypothetical protein